MKIQIMVKQIGKRKPIIGAMELELPGPISTMGDLIEQIVRINVDTYNRGTTERQMIRALTDEAIAIQAESGKVGFGVRYSTQTQNADAAVNNARLSFQDGLYKAFINETEILSLDDRISLKENDSLLFMRLTMLAGRSW